MIHAAGLGSATTTPSEIDRLIAFEREHCRFWQHVPAGSPQPYQCVTDISSIFYAPAQLAGMPLTGGMIGGTLASIVKPIALSASVWLLLALFAFKSK